jgi:hypothetical protein
MKIRVKEFKKIVTQKTNTLTNKGVVNKLKIKKVNTVENYYR